jgi:cell cycle sensor histidine kinase DivJ
VLRDATTETTRLAELESAREEAEASNAGKSRFLANMSHELRTPLNAVIGFSDVMKSGLFGQLPPKYAEYAEMIHDAGRHLLELINDVLDISKIEAARYELNRDVFDARDAVSSALRLTRLQADEARVSLRGLLPSQPLEALADPRALKQIVLNLVSNALKFTPSGGSVTVSVKGYGEDLEVVVSDTGVGIAEADLERLGRPYEQAGDASQKVRGAGLGLSLVRAFAELHGGTMSIESRLGEGTSVTVRMPVLQPTPATAGAEVIAFKPVS